MEWNNEIIVTMMRSLLRTSPAPLQELRGSSGTSLDPNFGKMIYSFDKMLKITVQAPASWDNGSTPLTSPTPRVPNAQPPLLAPLLAGAARRSARRPRGQKHCPILSKFIKFVKICQVDHLFDKFDNI